MEILERTLGREGTLIEYFTLFEISWSIEINFL